METVSFISKEIIEYDLYDVVVIGGGTAGAIAGISSAMEGNKTLIIEQYGALGGSQTLGMVNPMMPSFIRDNPSSSSICDAINTRMVAYGAAVKDEGARDRFFDPEGFFNPDTLQLVLEEIALEVNCSILYHTVPVETLKNDNSIEQIIVANKNGLTAIKAKAFIDCTGDADLAVLAGISYESGNENVINQSISLKFEMSNIDMEKFEDYLKSAGQKEFYSYPTLHVDDFGWAPGFRELVLEKHREGLLTSLDIAHLQMFSIPGKPYSIVFNCPELGSGKNVISASNMSIKQIEGKKAIRRIRDFMIKNVPGFENSYITKIAPILGIRESRRIIAEYILTKEDIFAYRKFDDGIAMNNFFVDVHGLAVDKGEKLYADLPVDQRYYEIPYRCMIPVGIDNLLVAGRCAGFDFYAQSSARVQKPCRAMGEAAGIACALLIKEKVPFKDIDGSSVRSIMSKRGAEFSN